MPRVVLVTGVSRYLGGRLAADLARDLRIERVIGVDTVPPDAQSDVVGTRAEFVRADIRNPLIAKVIAQAEVDTVVHLSVLPSPHEVGSRTAMKEINVIGTMQLLAACQKSPTLRTLVVRSTTAVYGSSSRDPALFTEDVEPRAQQRSGYAKDALEVEGYVRGFGRRRPDVDLTVLRFTNLIGPTIQTPLSRYLALPVVPTVLGADPRLQLCHEDDALAVLRAAAGGGLPGTFNAGGAGVLLLSQALRRLGRVAVPVVRPAVGWIASGLRAARLGDVSADQLRYLEHGRVADVSRLAAAFPVVPRSTAAAFAVFAAAAGVRTAPAVAVTDGALAVSRRVRDLIGTHG